MDITISHSDTSKLPGSPQIVFKESSHQSCISLSSTDAFSLNTFDELVEEHSQLRIDGHPDQRRCLIIARVRTWDEPTGRYFDLYYNAWHLNKILFRLQVSSNRTYIHRLSVPDPMTNAEIVKVEYFRTGDPSLSGEALSSSKDAINNNVQISIGGMSTVIPANLHISKHSQSSNNEVLRIPKMELSHVTAHYLGTDDDYMTSNALRKCFRLNAIVIEDAELFTLQPLERASFIAGNEWTNLVARHNYGRYGISCSPVDTLLQAAGVLFCCALYYVHREEEEEYGLEQYSLAIESEDTQVLAESTAHDYWQPISAVNDLTLTFST
ncbi:hypothetical protein BGW37DRAFT_557523 [Umbelopsis sp. PMI_123]|nr:hypothetical protein BGW37DRAFT_557523 [Umbelopsis sp. PMI_123]